MFLIANTILKVVLRIFLLTLRNADVFSVKQKLTLKFYIIVKVLSTNKRVKIIDKKFFAKATLDKNVETFVMYIIFLLTMTIHSAKKA